MLERVEPEQFAVERHRLIDDWRRRLRCVEAIDGPVGFEKGAEHTELPESYWRWGTIAWEWSTLTYAGRSFGCIEVLVDEPPPTAAAPSATMHTAHGAKVKGARPWITAEVERLKAAGQLEAVKRITDLAKLLETHMRKCAERDNSLRPVGKRYLRNQLRRWGLWPLTP
jgi:hypothetical protein